MQSQKGKLELGKEYIPADEPSANDEIEQINKELLKQDYPANIRPVRRDAHAKHHGCVKAEFIVEADLPEEMRFGIFKESRSYPAWIRFSNSKEQDDSKDDGRGMAIKLMGVEGEKLL